MTSSPPPDQNLLVQGHQLAVSQGDRTVLKDVQMNLAHGEFVYLIGRTGAGKTSLLRLLYADLRPAAGSLRVDEFNLEHIHRSQVPLLRRKLGIVFQDFQLLPHLTVYENVAFALRCTGWKNKKHIDDRVHEVLQQVGMHPNAGQYPHELSGGEQQRTAIARALVNRPVLLITDEPTGNLDPEATERVLELLWDVNRHGTAIIMATHTHGLIERRPARVLEVAEGTLLDRGRPTGRPKTQIGAA